MNVIKSCAVFIVLTMLLAACAATTAGKAYQVGDVSKTTAEGAYSAIYKAHQSGHVSKTDMATAQTAYDAWADVQTKYVQAAKEGKPTGDYATYVSKQLNVLINLAAKYGLL